MDVFGTRDDPVHRSFICGRVIEALGVQGHSALSALSCIRFPIQKKDSEHAHTYVEYACGRKCLFIDVDT